MKPVARAALFTAALGALLITGAPAVLLDAAVDQASAGRYRLAFAEGTLWNGQARLATADSSATLSPITGLRWQLEPGALIGARLRWRLEIDGGAPATLELGLGGLAAQRVTTQLPPAAALDALPHAIARAGWRGILDLRIPGLACRWSGHCEGSVVADWRAGGVDILPGQALGDHRISAVFGAQATTLELATLREVAIKLNGKIELSAEKPRHVDLEIGGDPQFLARLQGILNELGAVQEGAHLRIRY